MLVILDTYSFLRFSVVTVGQVSKHSVFHLIRILDGDYCFGLGYARNGISCLDCSSRSTSGGFFGYDGDASFYWVLVPFVIIFMINAFTLSILGIAFLILAVVGISVII